MRMRIFVADQSDERKHVVARSDENTIVIVDGKNTSDHKSPVNLPLSQYFLLFPMM